MSVVFNEGTNIPGPGTNMYKLRRCTLCDGSFVSANENSEICDDCRTRELQKADQSLDNLDPTGANTSGGKRRVRLCLDDVASESSKPELPIKSSLAKTQWRSPPFKILFDEPAHEESSDLVAAKRRPKRGVRLRNEVIVTVLVLLVGVGLWISSYGVPEMARQFAQRAIAALR